MYRRAVEGWDEPVFHGGKQVVVRRRYSDALLRMMSLRGTQVPERPPREPMPIAEVERVLLQRLDRIARAEAKAAEAEKQRARIAAAEADRMRAAGLCP